MQEKNIEVKRSSAGLGVFAKKDFDKGVRLIEYIGEHISHDEADQRGGQYLFTLNKKIVIDGKDRKNTARYFNHSCKPNCYTEVDENERHVYIYTKRKVKEGEELTYNYGKVFFDQIIKNKPGGCRCEKCRNTEQETKS